MKNKKAQNLHNKSKRKEKLNPFEVHINHSKHKVLGQKSKDDHGLPGVSRGKAYRKRVKSLLGEYRDRHKDTKFLDKRIGEKNKSLDPEKKIMLRMAAEKKRQFSKKSLYNLNDDEQLMHRGKTLNEVTMQDRNAFSDDDDDDDLLDADFVKDRHFGGDIFTKRKEIEEGKTNNSGTKGRKEWIEEMIVESKRKKAESKNEKEIQHDAVSKLDAKFQDFLSLMKGRAMTDEDKEKSKKNCEFRDYDMYVRELAFGRSRRANPTDRLKTEEELAKEEEEKLRKLEEDRQRRMRGETEISQSSQKSADALDDGWGFLLKNSSDQEKSREPSIQISLKESTKNKIGGGKNESEESASEKSEDESTSEKSGDENEDEQSASEKSDYEEESEEDSGDESDHYPDVLDNSASEDEGDEEESRVEHYQAEKYKESSSSSQSETASKKTETEVEENDKNKMSKETKEELPYTFDVPNEYDRFWDLLQNRTPSQASTIIERMIACNHPKLGADNKNKANTIFAYLLQTLHIICGLEPEFIHEEINPLKYIDSMILHLYTLTQLNPPDCASALTQVIDEKYEDYSSKKPRKYPYADTYIFLKISGLLFPASDYHHDVMTRVITFITQILGEGKINSGREVVALLFTSSLLFEYLNRSARFVGELMNALNGVLYLSIPSYQSKVLLPHTPPFKGIGPSSDILVLDQRCRSYTPPRLTFSLLNEDLEITDNLKVKILSETLKLMDKLCHKWVNLSAVRSIFSPATKLLERIPVENYPSETRSLLQALQTSISNLPNQVPHLTKVETQMKTLRLLEPAIEEVVEGMKKRGGSKELQEKQKLLHKLKRERKGAKRELKRDAEFIAREQLREVLASDAERKRKVNLIMQGLAVQESEFKKFKSKK